MSVKIKQSSSYSELLKLPDGVEKFKIYPEVDGRYPVGFRLAGNRTMGVFVSCVLGGTVVEKVRTL